MSENETATYKLDDVDHALWEAGLKARGVNQCPAIVIADLIPDTSFERFADAMAISGKRPEVPAMERAFYLCNAPEGHKQDNHATREGAQWWRAANGKWVHNGKFRNPVYPD